METSKTFSRSVAHLIMIVCMSSFFIFSCTKIEPANSPVSAGTALLKTSSKLNIILILADDIGYEVPTYSGGQSYTTPNLNMMAAQGLQFEQCHSTPLCSPSRTELLTGKYSFRNYGAWGDMDTTNRTIANMLRDNGYNTLATGKWQLNGGDAGIHALGFNDYLVHGPFTRTDGGDRYGAAEDDDIADLFFGGSATTKTGGTNHSCYKDPDLYWQGAYYGKEKRIGKYGDDEYVNYISKFIDSNKNRPFFIYYAQSLCHQPFCPTPEDPEYAAWDMAAGVSDTSFFPSMVKYSDEKIGQVIQKVKDAGIADHTVIIYTGDNGTDGKIFSYYKGKRYRGGKSRTPELGTHVPLIVWCPAKLKPGIDKQLIDFSDFLPTIADIANVRVPASYGIIDGKSFYPYVMGDTSAQRDWIFCHYDQNVKGEGRHPIRRWTQDSTYKLYDSTNLFYNIKRDLFENHPLADNQLTAKEKAIKQKFAAVLASMHN